MDERFRKAEEEYFILRGKLDTGRIGKNLFELALRDSMVQDAEGRWWMLGPDTGNWYMHDGARWIESDPSRIQVAEEVTSAAPKSSPGKSSAEGTGSPNRLPLFVGIGCAAMVCIAIVIAGSYGILNFPLRPSSSSPNVALGTPLLPLTTPTLSSSFASVTPSLPATETTTSTSTRSATPRPSNTAAPSFPPGIYVTAMRIDPPLPKRRFDVTFYATFLNTTGAAQSYRLVAFVYRPDQTRPMGQSFTNAVNILPGTSELAAPGWVLTGPGGCEDFSVRIGWVDDQKHETIFNLPSGQPFQIPITVCP